MKRFDIQIEGMHCQSCEVLIEKEIRSIKHVTNSNINYKTSILHITTAKDTSPKELIKTINKLIGEYGYNAKMSTKKYQGSKTGIIEPFVISLLIFFLFFLIQKSGLLSNYNLTENSIITPFLIGIVASVSSCMAMVGSLVISLATLNDKPIALVKFHLARLISFFILGGVLGLIGEIISINDTMKMVLNIFVYALMIVLGINMLNIVPRKFLPNISFPKLPTIQKAINSSSPILLGFITFFLPCGFTQSMQIYAINQGSLLSSSLTMFSFSLGTLPVLLLLSFGVYSLKKNLNLSFLLKISGFLIILFTIYNLVLLLISLGIIGYV